jgi:hypothetical protein
MYSLENYCDQKQMHNFQSHGIALEQSNKHINCNTFINVQYATLQKYFSHPNFV